MKHKLVETVLDVFGYREVLGEEAVYDGFDLYLEERGMRAAQVGVNDDAAGDFLDWLLSKQAGALRGGDEGAEAAGAGLGDGEEDEGAYDSPDYSCSESGSEEGEEEGDGDGEAGSDRDSDVMVIDEVAGDSDVELMDAAGGGECEIEEIEEIEESSDDEGAAAGGWRQASRPASAQQRRQPLGTTPAAGAGGGGGQAQASGRGGFIDNFFQRLPKGTPSNAALAGPPPLGLHQQRGQQQQHAWRPATEEEARMDPLDFVNSMVFGNPGFRSQQREIVQAALRGRDCFVLMPTGGGKSLTYQLPAVITRGLTVVVTPLLSLMQDQVQALNGLPNAGVPTTYLSSQQTVSEQRAVFQELGKERPTIKLLYLTPEQLVKGGRLQGALGALHRRGLLARIVIDEAHCVSAWGHDFRPDYAQVGAVTSSLFPGVPMMALTATATTNVRDDIVKTLRMRRPLTFQVSFFRPNLYFSVKQKDYTRDEESGLPAYMLEMLLYIQNHREGSGIVYCLSRDDTESVAAQINQLTDISASHYHAGMTPKQRMQVQNDWRTGRIKVVCATIAFGMGVDKADVRYVLHFCLSKSMEGYYQEAGRAGRDGQRAECVLFYAKRDVPRILQLLHHGKRGRGGKGQFQREVDLVKQMQAYCEEGARCRHAHLVEYFGEQWRGQGQQGQGQGCGDVCDICDGSYQQQQAEQQQKQGGGSGKQRGSGGRSGGGKRAQQAPAPAFQSAASLLSGQQQQQQQGPAGSARALKMQQAAVDAGGWRTKKKGKENPAAAAAAPPKFVTAAQLAHTQAADKQQQQGKPRGKAGGGAKAVVPAKVSVLDQLRRGAAKE